MKTALKVVVKMQVMQQKMAVKAVKMEVMAATAVKMEVMAVEMKVMAVKAAVLAVVMEVKVESRASPTPYVHKLVYAALMQWSICARNEPVLKQSVLKHVLFSKETQFCKKNHVFLF